MKKYILIMGLIAGTVLLGTVALADKEPLQPQTKCPVMGGKIDKKAYADYNGKRVYFCCPGCIEQFKKEPDKYPKKLEAEGVTPEPIPTAADTEKKEAPKDTCGQPVPNTEHKHCGN